jgi:hypothetical protein
VAGLIRSHPPVARGRRSAAAVDPTGATFEIGASVTGLPGRARAAHPANFGARISGSDRAARSHEAYSSELRFVPHVGPDHGSCSLGGARDAEKDPPAFLSVCSSPFVRTR